MNLNPSDYYSILPALTLTILASILLLVDVFLPKGNKSITAVLSAGALLVTIAVTSTSMQSKIVGFYGMIARDGFSDFLGILFAVTGLLGITIAYGYNRRMGIDRGEYYSLLLFSVVGMMLMAQAADLIVVFLSLELLSIPLYVMAALAYPKVESEEAGLKYFLLGAFSTGFIVYGIALTFGATGSTSIYSIAQAIAEGTARLSLLLVGAGLIFVGFAFKVAAVPFHMWTPDVYQGAPTSVTAFMSSGAKAAGFAAMLRVFAVAWPALSVSFFYILFVVAMLSLILGNLVAVAQKDIKRMLAYASIAQGGYILMAFVPYGNTSVRGDAIAAALLYLAAYTLASFGAWAVVASLEKTDGTGLQVSDYAGLGRKNPLMAACMTVFMLSFVGLPPTLGLVGKMYLFSTAVNGDVLSLAIVAVLMTLVSAYYYLNVIRVMYMKDGNPKVEPDRWLQFTFIVAALATVLSSIFAWPLLDLAYRAAMSLF